MRPIIGITLGDPAGIGPEIVIDALQSGDIYKACIPVVIGHAGIMRRCADALDMRECVIATVDSPRNANGALGLIEVAHVETPGMQDIEPGKLSPEAGAAADAFIRKACELALAGEIDAISTTPINKESLRLAGVEHIGHTEMLASYLHSSDPLTMFVTENMRIFFLSRHLSLRRAIDFITEDRVYQFIKRVNSAMIEMGFAAPTIGLAALNPHASDGGQFGDEEAKFLIPAAMLAKSEGIIVSEPIGADSVFNMALEGRFDCVISLYHDQGHIAAKTRDFHGTVTATLGLPVLRTSVDHGTALDIAWKGKANSASMKSAILAATELLSKRTRA